MVRGLGMMYAAVLAVIACFALGLGLLGKLALWLPLQLGIAMFAVLSIFSVLGGALYERRNELGLEARISPERIAERQSRADSQKSADTVAEAYGLVRVGSHSKAWAVLQDWLASRGNLPPDYRFL